MSDIAQRLEAILEAVSEAKRRSGREGEDITLVAASKKVPVPVLEEAYALGLRHFGENRVQEAAGKVEKLPGDCVWHLIGRLQRNKAKDAVRMFSFVHSVDRPELADALERAAAARDTVIRCFLQVNVAEEPQKGGVPRAQVRHLAAHVSRKEHLRAVGLMSIPPQGPVTLAREVFRQLRELRDELRADHDDMRDLSMGMSADFVEAIEEGATHIRVGTALFGRRD